MVERRFAARYMDENVFSLLPPSSPKLCLRFVFSQLQSFVVSSNTHANVKEIPVHAVRRPYVTAGVALVGAGLIAATPAVTPPPKSPGGA